MNDKQAERLIKTAQQSFVKELKDKITEIELLLSNCKDNFTESDTWKVIRFFHSINGTASTLGLHYLSSIGKEWEKKLKDINEAGQSLDTAVIKDLYVVVNSIKKKVDCMDAQNNISSEYVNMPYRGKILLVDDDITILKLLENAFTLEGYKVYICDDAASAMDTIAVVRPDIIVLDIMMPRLSGYEILEGIRSKPEYTDVHVIFLSARKEADEKIHGIKLGADDYITKPFTIGEVTTRVEMIMRRSENYKEKLLKDCLTDAYSRYYFNLRIAEELERYRRNDTIFSIAFIDMDHYKQINDRYGHQAGDHVLKELVSYIAGSIRKCDSIYRYGGEEFVILLPDTTEEKACEVIERLRQGLSRKPISVDGSTIHVTFSAGIKQISGKDESVEQLIGNADKAMYYAKKCGRNRVMVFDRKMEAQSSKKTLLIVDNENTILKLLKDRFSSIGYNVFTAKDGKSAVELAAEVHPEAIILDLILPDIEGFEVCRLIKENTTTRSAKIIMLSKKKQEKSIIKGLNFGADDYITKSFSMEELEARIIRALYNIC